MSREDDRIREAAERYRRARTAADRERHRLYWAIRKANKDGMSLGQLAMLTDLSRSRIQQITEAE